MKEVSLDANCFIDACDSSSHAYEDLKDICDLRERRIIKLFVSLQTLSELEARGDAAYKLATSTDVLPHYSIGSWAEQVGSWAQEAGTWKDGRDDDVTQKKIEVLAKSGNDIRDRGAYIDAIRGNMYAFITSDKQLVGSGPAKRLNNEFKTQVFTPNQLLSEYSV